MSIGSRHISFARIVDLVEGRFSLVDQLQAQSHTANCSRCAAVVAWLTHVIGLMRDDNGEDAASHVVAQAVDLFRMRQLSDPRRRRQRVQASLRFDSGRMPQPLGVRAGAQSERQLLFNAGDADLDLRIVQAGELWSVTGQVLGLDVNGQVELHGAGATTQAVLNERSEFRLPPVPSGIYTLTVRLANADIEVVGLEVGA